VATVIGNDLECKKRIKKLLGRIEKGEYKILNIVMQTGIETTEEIEEKDGQLYRIHKKGHHDTFTINYIDKD